MNDGTQIAPFAWRRHFQDWRMHRFGDPEPRAGWRDFATKAEADAAKAAMRANAGDDHFVLCVTPAPKLKAKKLKAKRSVEGVRS
jgi:hypothetical protein